MMETVSSLVKNRKRNKRDQRNARIPLPSKQSKFQKPGCTSNFKALKSRNPFLDLFQSWNEQSAEQFNKHGSIFSSRISDRDREVLFSSLPLDSIEEYAWAIPDERALSIVRAFAPVVEIGCGKGYWCRLLREIGVDIIAYDKNVPDSKDAWTKILRGGSECLSKHTKRSLFLCYPDDFEESDVSLAAECLKRYRGDTVILVGEWLGQTVLSSNPCGKSISIEAQLALCSEFHLLITIPLPSFPTSCDSLTVWRRTKQCQIDGEWRFANIPQDEGIPIARACPAFSHLLTE